MVDAMNTIHHILLKNPRCYVWRVLCLVSCLFVLSACGVQRVHNEGIVLDHATFVVGSDDSKQLSITQRVPLTEAMFEALDGGIHLYFDYQVHVCMAAPLRRELMIAGGIIDGGYVVRWAGHSRTFPTQADLLAGLDRLSMELPSSVSADCQGAVQVALALTRLPTPMRFPAFFRPDEWRLSSQLVSWQK